MKSLKDIKQPIEQEFDAYEKAFIAALKTDTPLLGDVLDYVLSKRGKQLRPLLVLLSAKVGKGITDKTIDTAIALELLHTSSLIHDDVVDSSPMRRGAQSVQEKWTNKVAVLTGDYMLAQVIALINKVRNSKILSIVSRLGADLSSGEFLQLHANSSMWISEAQYYKVIEHKTAKLFAACTEAGAESSGASMKQVSSLRDFGLNLGMCFQLKDDVLDYSDSEEIGKPTMNDIRDGKVTLPLLIALKRAEKSEVNHIKRLAEAVASGGEHIHQFEAEQEIKSFVLRYDGIRYAYQQMQYYKDLAVKSLSSFHDSDAKQSLLLLLDYAINRVM